MSEFEDPPRWAESDAPPGALDLVRAIERPPSLPLPVRVARAPRLPRRLGAMQVSGLAGATAIVLGGLTLWVFRPAPPVSTPAVTPRAILVNADAGSPQEPLDPADAGSIALRDGGLPVPTGARVLRAPPASTGRQEPIGTQTSEVGAQVGTLRVNTRPASAVYTDGRLIGNTPQMNVMVPAGTHTLTFRYYGGEHRLAVVVGAGETVTLVLTLTPDPPLAVAAGPSPRDTARTCAAARDHACVIRLLRFEPDLDEAHQSLLIEAYRASGRGPELCDALDRFLRRFPASPSRTAFEDLRARACEL